MQPGPEMLSQFDVEEINWPAPSHVLYCLSLHIILIILVTFSFVLYSENNVLLCAFALFSLSSEELYLGPELRC